MDSRLILQVHDELVFETPKSEEAALSAMLREVMSNALKLDVPLRIDLKTGYTWGDLEVSEDLGLAEEAGGIAGL
jgi:DNA polymerase-1